jgi:ABC-type oligopeptide transport system substrate-binding subunit
MLMATVASAGAVRGQNAQPITTAGGTLRIGRQIEFQSLDPALGYGIEEWRIGFATCAKLYNYPDAPAPKGLIAVPEVATAYPTLSRDGRTNTIVLRRTFRFSTGARITAANFVAAFNRDANPQLKSPTDQYLHEIVGADAVLQGQATEISGVRALDRYTLQIRTTQPLPDLVSRLTMPFFCPVPVGTPGKEQDELPGSGPFYIASHVPNRQLLLSRNPFYGGNRHPHVQHIEWTLGIGGEASRVAVEHNQSDLSALNGVPDADVPELVRKYGVNRKGGRFFVHPALGTWRFVFNHARPAFNAPGQIPFKQAINWALDRHALVAENGPLTGKRTDQILPPALTRAANIYPLGGVNQERLARARTLLAKAKKPTKLVLYAINASATINWAQIFRYDLKQIAIDVDVKYFDPSELYNRLRTPGEPWDVALGAVGADYADPFVFFAELDGRRGSRNPNLGGYFNRPRYNRRIEAINRLRGAARSAAWANLDADMMRNDPPWAPFMNGVRRHFISQSFGCYLYQPALGDIDLVAACKK